MTTTLTDTERFLQAVYPDYKEQAIFARTISGSTGMQHMRSWWALDQSMDCYWSIARFPNDGSAKRVLARALGVVALVIDDVGTKVPMDAVEKALGLPSAIVETSTDNYQWTYRLSTLCPVDQWGAVFAAVEQKIGVKLDGRDAVHLFRLPMGRHTKSGFRVALIDVDAGVTLDVNTLLVGSGPVGPVSVLSSSGGGANDTLGLEALRGLMGLIPNDITLGRDEWVEIGHGLKALADNDADGFQVFDEWSQTWPGNYDEAETARAWDTFGASGLKSKGVGLKVRAQTIDPGGFEKWKQGGAVDVFDDGADHSQAPAPPGPGAYPVTHKRMAEEIEKTQHEFMGWIDGRPGAWGMFDDVMRCWVISGNDACMHRAVENEINARIALGVDAKTRALMHKAGWHHSVASLVRNKTRLRLSPSRFDNNDNLLGMPGYTLEMNGVTLTSRQGEPWDSITKSTSVRPAPAGTRGKHWEKFLGEFTGGDFALRRWWQVFCGYCLTGHTSEHVVVFVYGPGGNGKSVFLDIIAEVMGTYHERADHRLFMDSKGAKHLAPLAVLEGARLVTVPDVAVGAAWDLGLVKQVSGGGTVTANRMRQDPTTYVPQFKIVMAGNEKPRMDTVDAGVRRRIKLVPATFRPRAVDVGLMDKLRGEKAEILRWMVDGWSAWALGGLPACQVIEDATSDYLDGADVFGRWIGECVVVKDARSSTRVADAFRSWDAFRTADGSYSSAPNSPMQIATKLKDAGFTIKRDKAGAYIEGVELATNPQKVF